MITRRYVPGGWESDAIVGGDYFSPVPTQNTIATSRGDIPQPGQNLLFAVCDVIEGVLVGAGQGHADGGAWLWNGATWIKVSETTYGTSPCAFGPHGYLYVSTPRVAGGIQMFHPLSGAPIGSLANDLGSRGFASVDDTGIHGQDRWYGAYGLAEFVELNGIRIGQGANGGLVAAGHGEIEPGNVQFIRVHRRGNDLAVAAWKPQEGRAVFVWLTVADLASLTPADTPPPPPPPPPPEEPAMEAPNQIDTVRRVMSEHREIDTKDEATRGAILPFIIEALGGFPWGRKSRNKAGTDLNTDAVTYRRQDGLFEIYDVIDGGSGGAAWDGFGPFKDGENGYFVEQSAAPLPTPIPRPKGPTLDAWINQELPQLIAAYQRTHNTSIRPDAEWGSFQCYRRYVEAWPLDRMLESV